MRRVHRLAVILLALGAAPMFVSASRQNPPPPPRDVPMARAAGSAVISGVVVTDEATPAPVRRARVTVRSEEYGNGFSATTDDAGRFAVRALPAGRYTVQAGKPAWIGASYGATRPGRPGTPIVVADGARVQGLTLRMSRGAVLTGTVVDHAGQPLPGVAVTPMRYVFSDVTGERALSRAGSDALTDDLGIYRCYGLAAGDYLVMASLRAGPPTALMDLQRITEDEVTRALAEVNSSALSAASARPALATIATSLVGYAPVFFPGTPDTGRAVTVKLGSAEERAGLTITLDLVPTARVEAAPALPANANPQSLQVYLVAQQSLAAGAAGMTTGRRDADGRVVFAGVTPGAYTVIARAAVATDPAAPAPPPTAGRGRGGAPPLTLYATADINVDGRDLTVPLELASGMTVSGRVTFDDPASAPNDAAVSVALVPIKSGPALSVSPAATDASGAFRLVGVPAGRYRVDYSAARSLDAWRLVSAVRGGREVLDEPLEIRSGEDATDLVLRFTNRPSELTGRLQTSSGQAAPAFSIVVFSVDRAFWTPLSRRVRQVRPATDGAFSVRGLPSGDYYVAALTDVEPGEWYNPAFLAQLVGASAKVMIREGERTVQDLMIR